MRTVKISPSLLETYRKYKDEEFNGKLTEADVIEAVMGTKEWNQAMTFGSAFHAVLENGHEKYFNPATGKYEIFEDEMPGVVELTLDDLEVAIEHRAKYPGMVHECKAQVWLDVPGYRVLINMRIDGMFGTEIHEHKTTTHSPKFEGYYDSLQWRCYILATEAPIVQYNIFQYYERENGSYKVTPNEYKFYPYANLEREVKDWIVGLLNFCERKGIIDKLNYPAQSKSNGAS